MQASLALAVLALLASSADAGKSPDCGQHDPTLLYCPAIQAPRITELAPGIVVVAFTVKPDGSVTNAHVVQSNNAQWNASAVKGISLWRFKPSGHSVNKSQRIDFTFQP